MPPIKKVKKDGQDLSGSLFDPDNRLYQSSRLPQMQVEEGTDQVRPQRTIFDGDGGSHEAPLFQPLQLNSDSIFRSDNSMYQSSRLPQLQVMQGLFAPQPRRTIFDEEGRPHDAPLFQSPQLNLSSMFRPDNSLYRSVMFPQLQSYWSPFGGSQQSQHQQSESADADLDMLPPHPRKRPADELSGGDRDKARLDAALSGSVLRKRKAPPIHSISDDDGDDEMEPEDKSTTSKDDAVDVIPNKVKKKKPRSGPIALKLAEKVGKKKIGEMVEGAFIDDDVFLSSNLKSRFKVTVNKDGEQTLTKLKKDKPAVRKPLGKDAIKNFMGLGSKSDKASFYATMQKLAHDARVATDPKDPAKKKLRAFMSIMDPTRPDASDIKEELDSYIRSDAWTRKGDKAGYGEDETMQTSLFMLMLRRTAGLEEDTSPFSVMKDGTKFDWLDLHRGLRNPTGYMPLGGRDDRDSAHPGTLNENEPGGGKGPRYMSRLNSELDENRTYQIMLSRHPMSAARRAKRAEQGLLRLPEYLQSHPSKGYAVTGLLHSDPVQVDKNVKMMRTMRNISRIFSKFSKTAADESDSEISDGKADSDFDTEGVTRGISTPDGLTKTLRDAQEANNKVGKKQ